MPDAPDSTAADASRATPPGRAGGPDAERPGDEAAAPERSGGEERADLWRTLGFRSVGAEPGAATLEWDAPADYCFPTASGLIVQGGLVTALLDAAMGSVAWSAVDDGEQFLTADLRVEFLRSSRPGLLRATGFVVRRTRRVVFCGAEMSDAAGQQLATSRCTQVVLPARGQTRIIGTPEDAVPPASRG
jgi:uncharacterized protein (TIGR00369 family)